MYDNSEWKPPAKREFEDGREHIERFSLVDYIKHIKERERKKLFSNHNPFESKEEEKTDDDSSIEDDDLKRLLEELSD